MEEFLNKLRNGEMYTRAEYAILVNSYPNNVFKVRPHSLPEYESRVNAEELFIDLKSMTNIGVETNKLLTIGSERTTYLLELRTKLTNLLELAKPLSDEVYNTTREDLEIGHWENGEMVTQQHKTLAHMISNPSILIDSSNRQRDVARYLELLGGDFNDTIFELLDLDRMNDNSVQFDELIYSLRQGKIVSILKSFIGTVSSELVSINSNKKVLLIDRSIDKSIIVLLKLAVAVTEE